MNPASLSSRSVAGARRFVAQSIAFAYAAGPRQPMQREGQLLVGRPASTT